MDFSIAATGGRSLIVSAPPLDKPLSESEISPMQQGGC
jgi:hypothetical protein